ncbi:MAG: pyrroloquinoline quinone-dependent dehydrogenase [Acidobacteriota bacterium]
MTNRFIKAVSLLLLLGVGGCTSQPVPVGDWPTYLGGQGRNHYSPLSQIDTGNVVRLRRVWEFHTGDADSSNRSQIQCNPVVIHGILYGTSPQIKVFALDASSGRELWRFDPFDGQGSGASLGVNRGLVYWSDGEDRRILFTAGSFLYALDAGDGELIPDFGDQGRVDLRQGLGRDIDDLYLAATSPGAVYRNLLILGSRVGEGPGPAAPGHIRAFDIRTGKLAWIFHTIPQPGEFGYDTWPKDAWTHVGGANSWAGMSVDSERGIVFVPTGSPAFDFWGGNRKGANLFADCLLALDAATGKRIWHAQFVHHDLWDRDLPAPPNLVTLRINGESIDAVAQITKAGQVFVFNRETGEPLYPIHEVPVPASDLRGEETWPTQPDPAQPPPFVRRFFDESEVTDISPKSHRAVLERLRQVRSGGQFIPPSTQGTVIFPGLGGGGEWGGAAFDRDSGILYVNASEMPWILTMVDLEAERRERSRGEDLGIPYRHTGYNRFLDPDGYPAVRPPWGVLTALDLNHGKLLWQVPLGEYPELTARGIPPTGTENYGGPIVTGGGLIFIAATRDEMFRAFDKKTGKLLWQTKLPAGGYATPCTYEVGDRQFVVVAAGGGKMNTRSGDSYVAFALPR